MRRLLVWTIATATLLMAGGQRAVAKEKHEDPREGATGVLSSPPRDLRPGHPWNALIMFLKDGRVAAARNFSPSLTLANIDTGEVVRVPTLLVRPGVYSARILFPSEGRWSMALRNGFDGRVNDLTTLRIDPAPAPAGGRSFPLWGWAVSGLLSLLLVTGGFLVIPMIRRRQRALLG